MRTVTVFSSFARLYCSKINTTGRQGHAAQKSKGDSRPGSALSTFDNVIALRRLQAEKSIVVQVSSVKSAGDVYGIVSKFGKVSDMHHYTAGNNEFFLVELTDSETALEVLTKSTFNADLPLIPVQSRFLWLRSNGSPGPQEKPPCLKINSNPQDLDAKLITSRSVSKQITTLHRATQLTELESRLRFLVCDQVEKAMQGFFASSRIVPFGSSVNGCGRTGSDLDMVFEYYNSPIECFSNPDSRLVYQAKAALSNGRFSSQRHMEIIADILQAFIPGPSQVRRILQARVPIIKFIHDYTKLECDLSTYNLSGFYMSELLYIFGEVDSRFRPLIFAVRWWAKKAKLTSENPGPYITNFSLSMLVIFYLQSRAVPLLPTLGSLIKLARPEDTRLTTGLNCTFLRDVTKIPKSENQSTLEELLHGFFHFVATFDFEQNGLSVISGKIVNKTERCAIYVQNPLERDLNVTKNMHVGELHKLKASAAIAREALESCGQPDEQEWGLLALTSSVKRTKVPRPSMVRSEETDNSTTLKIKDGDVISPELKSALEEMTRRRRSKANSAKLVGGKKSVAWKY